MKKLTFLLVTALLLSGCMTPKRIDRFQDKFCREFADTIIRDRPVKIPIYYTDSANLEMYLKCDSLGNIYQTERNTLNGRIISLESKLSDNKVTVYSRVKIHDTVYIYVTDTIIKTGTKAPEKTKHELTFWQKFFMKYGIASFVFTVLLLFYAIYRIVKRFIK